MSCKGKIAEIVCRIRGDKDAIFPLQDMLSHFILLTTVRTDLYVFRGNKHTVDVYVSPRCDAVGLHEVMLSWFWIQHEFLSVKPGDVKCRVVHLCVQVIGKEKLRIVIDTILQEPSHNCPSWGDTV